MPMELFSTRTNEAPDGAVVQGIRTSDGVLLRTAHWRPTGPSRLGTVCLFQGRAEAIEKYFEVIGELRARGFAVATFDWRGQGGSDRLINGSRRKGHVERFADYELDVDAFMRQVALPDCPPPFYALGHSMGAFVCLHAAQTGRTRFTRMVLAAPMLRLAMGPPMRVLRLLSRLALFLGMHEAPVPGQEVYAQDILPFPGNLLTGDLARFSRDGDIFRAVPQLTIGAPTFGWLYAATRAMRAAEAPGFAPSLQVPVLLVAAGRDRVVSTAAIERLSEQLRAGAHVVIPGARHEILMEEDALRQLFWAAFDAFVPGSQDLPRSRAGEAVPA
jgi:lysophospholipase